MPDERVLDVACGTGQLLALLAERLDSPQLVGVDQVPAMLEVAKQRVGQRAFLLECDASRLPFDDASFQLVTSTSALHYFQDPDAALREMRRVISRNGNLIIADWCRDYFWMELLNRILPLSKHPHAHTFNVKELERNLIQAGFCVNSKTTKKIDWFWGLMVFHAVPNRCETAAFD